MHYSDCWTRRQTLRFLIYSEKIRTAAPPFSTLRCRRTVELPEACGTAFRGMVSWCVDNLQYAQWQSDFRLLSDCNTTLEAYVTATPMNMVTSFPEQNQPSQESLDFQKRYGNQIDTKWKNFEEVGWTAIGEEQILVRDTFTRRCLGNKKPSLINRSKIQEGGCFSDDGQCCCCRSHAGCRPQMKW